jgi:hypothetical protein
MLMNGELVRILKGGDFVYLKMQLILDKLRKTTKAETIALKRLKLATSRIQVHIATTTATWSVCVNHSYIYFGISLNLLPST